MSLYGYTVNSSSCRDLQAFSTVLDAHLVRAEKIAIFYFAKIPYTLDKQTINLRKNFDVKIVM
jgi:hypothetical protein